MTNEGDETLATTLRCILVNYRSPWEMLHVCLDSLLGGGAGARCEVTLVDNASGDAVLEQVKAEFPAVKIIEMETNPGFHASVHRGLA